jgi:exonuclease III
MDLLVGNWNVRGLNNPARRKAILDFLADKHYNLICLQETKLEFIDLHIVRETLGPRFQDNFLFKPAEGTRGGILIACTPDFSLLPEVAVPGEFSLTATVTDRSDGCKWTITGVYGPQENAEKYMFIQKIRSLKPLVSDKWLIIGDFNLLLYTSKSARALLRPNSY